MAIVDRDIVWKLGKLQNDKNAEMLKPYYSNQCNMAWLQTTYYFRRPTKNFFISALLSSLHSQHTLQIHFGVDKYIQRKKCNYNAEMVKPYYSNQCNMARLQTSFSCRLTTLNQLINNTNTMVICNTGLYSERTFIDT